MLILTVTGHNQHPNLLATQILKPIEIPPPFLDSPTPSRYLILRMAELPTADLLALDTDSLKGRLSELRRYL